MIDNDELMRLRGQQVTLEKERGVIRSQIDTERVALRSFADKLIGQQRELPRDWLENETARLRRIAELIQRGEQIDKEVGNLKQFTGH